MKCRDRYDVKWMLMRIGKVMDGPPALGSHYQALLAVFADDAASRHMRTPAGLPAQTPSPPPNGMHAGP